MNASPGASLPLRDHALAALLALSGTCAAQCPYLCPAPCPLLVMEPTPPGAPPELEGRALGLALFPTTASVPGVYMCGAFRIGGVETGLVKRENGRWVPVAGAALAISAIAQHQDERGLALYAVADGWYIDSIPLRRYDGTSWQEAPAAPVLGYMPIARALSLASFDADGPGPNLPRLYLNEHFQDSPPVGVAYWNTGLTWALGPSGWTGVGGFDGAGSLVVYDRDGAGPALPQLYQQGEYHYRDEWIGSIDRGLFSRLAGDQWTVLADLPYPRTAAVYDPDGSGPLNPLIAIGGSFTQVQVTDGPTIPAPHVVLFDGTAFTVPGIGLPGTGEVQALAHFDPDGAGPGLPRLVAGGTFTVATGAPADGLAQWNGSGWTPFDGGALGDTEMLRAFDEDAGGPHHPTLAWSGRARVNHRAAPPVALHTDGEWDGLFDGPGGPVRALAVFDGGDAPRLYAAGRFDRCGDTVVNNIARWDGDGWSPLGAGLAPTQANPAPQVFAMLVHNDGTGPALYVAGSFQSAGGVAASNLARWTGSSWQAVGPYGISGGAVLALESHDPDGPGPLAARLYAGGSFTFAGGAPATHLAFWTGAAWNAVAGAGDNLGAIRALKSFDDGAGPALYVGGDQTPTGSSRLVWKLTSTGWVSLSATTAALPLARVNALEVHDDGAGPRLYVAGLLLPSPVRVLQQGVWATPTQARFRDAEFHALRSVPQDPVNALLMDGQVLSASSHTVMVPRPDGAVRAISPPYDDGKGLSVFLAGDFQRLDHSTYDDPFTPTLVEGTPFLARYTLCVPPCYANCDHSTAPPTLDVLDFNCFLNAFSTGAAYANCDQSTTPPTLNVLDFNCFLNAFGAGCP